MFEVLCFAQAPQTYYNASGVSQPKKKRDEEEEEDGSSCSRDESNEKRVAQLCVNAV